MAFDASKWPNAVTIGWLIRERLQLGVHCHPCGRFALFDPQALPIAPLVPVPSLEGRFKCTRCGSRETSARPEFGKAVASSYAPIRPAEA